MKHIQILVDNKYRDLYPAILLKLYIKNNTNKVRVILANKKNQHALYKAFCPEIVVLPHCFGYMNYHINYMKKRSVITVMPTAGSNISEMYVLQRYVQNTDEQNFKVIKRIFLWGEKVKDIFLRTGKYNESQLLVTGTPRLDIFRIIGQNKKELGKYIGFGPSIRHLTSIFDSNLITLINNYSRVYNKETKSILWKKGGQYADWIWYETAFLEALTAIIKNISELGNSIKMVIRPHPFESEKIYRDWVDSKKYSVDVIKNEPLWNFYSRLNLFVQAYSTTSVEAIYCCIPVISMKYLIGDRVKDHIPSEVYNGFIEDYLWKPKGIQEFIDLVEKAKKGQLAVSPKPEDLAKKLQELYNYDSDKLATQLIGNDLIKLIDLDTTKRKATNFYKLSKFLLFECYLLFKGYKKKDYNYSPIRINDIISSYEIKKAYKRYFNYIA